MAGENDPLWVVMLMAGESTPGTPRDAVAAEIRALADYIVPEYELPSSGDLAKMKWLARKEIRDRLLDEADLAEDSLTNQMLRKTSPRENI
jgi:hypothetical protein